MKKKLVFSYLMFLSLNQAISKELSLQDVIQMSNQVNPSLKAAASHVEAAKKSIDIAKSAYYPTLDLEAIDSTGFSGSTSALGIGGLMGSPFRSGGSIGLVSKWTIWDFGRTRATTEVAHQAMAVAEERGGISKQKLQMMGVRVFYACARDRTKMEAWYFLETEASHIEAEVKKFVKTGQKSIVEKYLTEAQTEEAQTAKADYEKRLQAAAQRIRILIHSDDPTLSCEKIPESLPKVAILQPVSTESVSNPFTMVVEKELALARAEQARIQADYLPQIVAIGSVGGLEQAKLVDKKEYSVGIGVIIPLFEGFKTSSESKKASAYVQAKEFELEAKKEELADIQIQYQASVDSAHTRVQHQTHELELAERAFQTAKARYLSSQGLLVDVREALRNLSRIHLALIDSKSEYLESESMKKILEGKDIL